MPRSRSPSRPPLNAALAKQLDGGEMGMLEGAGDLSGIVFARPVTVRAGLLMGIRYLSAPLSSFQPEPCSRRRRLCTPQATATIPLIQPRITIDYAVEDDKRAAAIGAYVGMDADPEMAWSGGVSFSWRVPYWDLAP